MACDRAGRRGVRSSRAGGIPPCPHPRRSRRNANGGRRTGQHAGGGAQVLRRPPSDSGIRARPHHSRGDAADESVRLRGRHERGGRESVQSAAPPAGGLRTRRGWVFDVVLEEVVTSRYSGWIGYACILAGTAAFAMFLTAAGEGFEGWSAIAAVGAVVLLAVGIGLTVVNVRRHRSSYPFGAPLDSRRGTTPRRLLVEEHSAVPTAAIWPGWALHSALIIVRPATDGPPGRPQQGENDADYQQDDSDRPQDRDAENKPEHEQNQTENDHGVYLVSSGSNLLRYEPLVPGLPSGRQPQTERSSSADRRRTLSSAQSGIRWWLHIR